MTEENTIQSDNDEVDTNQEQDTDLLNMSDEEILNMELPDNPEESSNTDDESSTEEADEDDEDDNEGESSEESEEDEQSGETDPEESSDDEEQGNSEEDKNSEGTEESTEESEELEEDSEEINYKEEYEKLLAPFRANNRDIKVDSPEDARTLMKMGANYNKKMAALKPNLRIIRTLDQNELLDESKINYLIDLSKHNPEAIKKLVRDSGLDLEDLEETEENKTEYTPNTYTASDKQVELRNVLEDIQETDTYSKTIDIVGNKWDLASRRILEENPEVIRVINDHVSNGIYDKINSVIEREKMLGRLEGVSSIEAYKLIGDKLQAEGAFNPSTSANVVNTPKTTVKKKATAKTNQKRKAASPTKSAVRAKTPKDDFNVLGMSDEEFLKSADSKYQ